MKQIIIILSAVLECSIALAQIKQDGYRINGSFKGIDTGKVYMAHFTRDRTLDSTHIEKGRFHFSGRFAHPTPVLIWPAAASQKKAIFFAEDTQIGIHIDTADLRNPVVTGSSSQKEYEAYQQVLRPFDEQIEKMYKLLIATKGNQQRFDSIVKVRELVLDKRKVVARKYIQDHPNTIVSAYCITRFFMSQPDVDDLEAMYKGLSPVIQQSTLGKEVEAVIKKEKLTSIGNMAPDFTQHDTLDQPVSLSSFRGKYVLIDFWASWCGPCRAENPNVVRAFNKYKDKNFTILGVSLDYPGKKQAWLDAIRKDGLTWTQVSDLAGWNNAASTLYGVSGIPSNFLIDPQGRIIGKNIREEKLHEALEAVLK